MENVLVWDGIEFQWIEKNTATKLIEEDKVQVVDDDFNYLSAKYRSDFSGYNTATIEAKVNNKKIKIQKGV